jgi:uncharacterized membrane protein YciS (DUF1049 family)
MLHRCNVFIIIIIIIICIIVFIIFQTNQDEKTTTYITLLAFNDFRATNLCA